MRTRRSIAVSLLTAFSVLAQNPAAGIDPTDLNRAADPCADLDEFTNGGWRAANPIPAAQSNWARRNVTAEQTRAKLRQILEAAAAAPNRAKGSGAQLIGDFYDSCLNEARLNRLAAAPLQPLLGQIRAIRDLAGINRAVSDLAGIRIHAPFAVASSTDPHDPEHVIADVDAGPLGLPDRDYFLSREPRFETTRARYVEHVAKMFVLAGQSEAAAASASRAVLDLETLLAQAMMSRAERRDPKAMDHPTAFAALEQLAPSIAWKKFFGEAKLGRGQLNVSQPKFLEAVNRALTEKPASAWSAYLEWHLLRVAAPSLSTAFVDQDFNFNGAFLNGIKAQRPRWERCVISADNNLGEPLGHQYVDKFFPPEAKVRVRQMAVNIAGAMKDSITHAEWMTPATRQKALEKIELLTIKVGYPDKWKDYSRVVVKLDSLWANVAALRRFDREDDLAMVGKPVNRLRWQMTPPTLNAYYDPSMNEIVVPAGYLQSPGFDLNAPDAVNYGAIGVTIGHEISHSVDDEGAQYDGHGRLTNWWTPEDYEKFKARADCVARQFDGYFIEPGIHHNGRLVLGEAIGDLAGVKMAYLAYRKVVEAGAAAPVIDGFTPDQQFFLAEARWRGAAARPEYLRVQVQSDPHPTAKYRVVGPLSNLPQFQTSFACKEGSVMARPAAERCTVW